MSSFGSRLLIPAVLLAGCTGVTDPAPTTSLTGVWLGLSPPTTSFDSIVIVLEEQGPTVSGYAYYLPFISFLEQVQGQRNDGQISLQHGTTNYTVELEGSNLLHLRSDGSPPLHLARLPSPGGDLAGRWVLSISRLNGVNQQIEMADTLSLDTDGRARRASERNGCYFSSPGTYRRAESLVAFEWPLPVAPGVGSVCAHFPQRALLQREGAVLVRREVFTNGIPDEIYERR